MIQAPSFGEIQAERTFAKCWATFGCRTAPNGFQSKV
jgi:hypothetical protein